MTRPHRIEVVEDAAGEWRWRLKAGNGRIIADSGEGYTTVDHAVRAAQDANPGVEVRVFDKNTDTVR